jgi:hypothetical protein
MLLGGVSPLFRQAGWSGAIATGEVGGVAPGPEAGP